MTDAQKFTQINDRTYIVEGKPILFQPGPVDLSDPKLRADVTEFTKNLYGDADLPAPYGPRTITQMFHQPHSQTGFVLGATTLSKLPGDVQSRIKAVMAWD